MFPELLLFVMETDSACAALISEKFYASDHLKAQCVNQSQVTCDTGKHASLDEIGLILSESLHIGDGPKMSPDAILCQPSDNINNIDNSKAYNDVDCKDLTEISSRVSVQELSKSDTFLCSGEIPLPAISTDGKDGEGVNDTAAEIKQASFESSKTAYARSLSLPSPLKLVSAMKGTREKMGKPRDTLNVTWAPDVYDPLPSASSTAVISNKPRRKADRKKSIDGKKNGKNKQKKKSSKGSSSKDKKPVQNYYRGTNACYQPFEGSKLAVEGFDCGSTFLKTSVTNLHFSLAEAT